MGSGDWGDCAKHTQVSTFSPLPGSGGGRQGRGKILAYLREAR